MVSVCLACHNGGEALRVQLDSILSQLSKDDEIVISDDGSNDETLELIKGYKDKRIKLFSYNQPIKSKHTHVYVTNNFENALNKAKGDYIFLSDQDDYWMPGKVETCLQKLQICDMVIHNMQIADDNLNPQEEYVFPDGFRFGNYLMKEGSYYGCATAFKRHILEAALPFPSYLQVHDIWIGLIAEAIGKVHYIEKPLMLYRYHGDSISHAVTNSVWFKVWYRVYTLFYMIIRLIKLRFR